MIDRIKKVVQIILGTDGRGNFKPSDFNLLLHNEVLEEFDKMLFEVNKLVNRENRGLVNGALENVSDRLREKIQHYLMPGATLVYAGGLFALPSDLRYLDDVLYLTESVELCRNNRDFNLINSVSHTAPSNDYPIGLKQGNSLRILPATIISDVTATYLRNPIEAKWTYTVINGVEIFNPSANDYLDVDIHPSCENELIMGILEKFGVNLKEQDIQAYVQRQETQELNENNSN